MKSLNFEKIIITIKNLKKYKITINFKTIKY